MPEKLVPPQMPEYFAPKGSEVLTDDALRSIATTDWVAHDRSAGEEPNWWAEVARRLANELLAARARVAELEQQASNANQFDAMLRLLDWRCMETTSMANFVPGDDRAVWCLLPKDHAGAHRGELETVTDAPVDGLTRIVPTILNWSEVSDRA